MDTKEKDDKKIAIGKNGKKSQIILNPPEIQTPVPYKENFLRAFQKHRVAIEEKVQIILNVKASHHDLPTSVLEQVYVRGVKSLPVNSNLTREQHAMNRVNSFLSGGAAMKQDMDLIPIHERLVTKQLKGTGGGARPHIKREKSPYNNKILYHVVDAKGRIKHTTSDEMAARRHLVQKYQSYLEGVESPMKRFEGTKSLVKTYKGDTPGEGKKVVAEAGPFSYGAKQPKKGSIAYLVAQKRKEQEKGKQPIEPNDQRVGVAKVTKGVAEEKMKGEDPCWKGYEMVGQKIKAGRKVPNCVPKNEEVDLVEYGDTAAQRFRRANPDEPDGPSYSTRRYSSYRAPAAKEEPHDVHINGKKWKTFGSQRHAQNVANKIKGATVHKSPQSQQEARKFGYDAINARFKKQTGQSLEDRAKHYAATSERLKKMQADYEAQGIIKKKDEGQSK